MSQENAFGNSAGLVISIAALTYLESLAGVEHLELFKDSAPTDKLADVFDVEVPALADIVAKQGPDATVGEFVAKLEAAVGPKEPVEPVSGELLPADAADAAEPAATNLGENGAAVVDTAQQPGAESQEQAQADQAAAEQETQAPVANLQATAAAPVVATEEPEWAQKLTTTGRVIKARIDAYMKAMAPRKPISDEAAARQQVQLYRSITGIINTTTEDFDPLWTYLLKQFQDHADGVFNELYVLRAMSHVQLPPNDVRSYQRLVNLLRLTADPQSRKAALKQVDIQQTLKFGISENGRQRVISFYEL